MRRDDRVPDPANGAPQGVVVAHTSPMIAEGIAAALGRIGISAAAITTTAEQAASAGTEAGAVVIDQDLPGADHAVDLLREQGKRVIVLGDGPIVGEGVTLISLREPVAALAEALNARGTHTIVKRLSRREREVLSLVSQGMTAKQIARSLGISPKTVEQYKARIFAKLGVPNQAAAVGIAVGGGLVGNGGFVGA